MKTINSDIQVHWEKIAPLLSIRTAREYEIAVERMNELLDEIGTNERHPLYSLLDVLGTLIYFYEEDNFPIAKRSYE
ncbi:MAG: hypothetical protein IT313_00050 [Anaerolineales bacterium]|nr:hypothetical protein [Anaerolineales bacterium]